MGAVEGSANFNIRDLKDLGVNTYRIYGGMSRWEAQDDDGRYGRPSIAEIKANPQVVNWAWWDRVMTTPPEGSDYWWSGPPETVWQGNARMIFSTLKREGIRPVLTIRNTDNNWSPPWALRLNPPRTAADWNEWWQHVFATAYWLNVRNDYRVDEYEIHNEPDNRDQGWGGNQADYFQLVRVAKDAIDLVYRRYLPNRRYRIHAPVAVGGSRWPYDTLQRIPGEFDSMNVHDYASDISIYTKKVRGQMGGTIHANSPIWLGEWGTYQNQYDNFDFARTVIQNAMRGSRPDGGYIYGSHIFSLYDWGGERGFKGLIGPDGQKRKSYFALRMAIRALQGGRQTFLTSTSNANLNAMTTQDRDGTVFLLVVNRGDESQTVNADLSSLKDIGQATIWEFSQRSMDTQTDISKLRRGRISFTIPAGSASLIEAI